MHRSNLQAFLAFAVLTTACSGEPPWSSPIAFDTARALVYTSSDTASLLVEVARTEAQTSYGLMDRPSLDPGSGMVFVYDSARSPRAGFWMWRTKMPLDIAYMDSAGRILTIRRMEPCENPYPEGCSRVDYSPGAEYWSALEVNRGWFREHGIGVGDRVVLVEGVAEP